MRTEAPGNPKGKSGAFLRRYSFKPGSSLPGIVAIFLFIALCILIHGVLVGIRKSGLTVKIRLFVSPQDMGGADTLGFPERLVLEIP